jgi:hypothetical protein
MKALREAILPKACGLTSAVHDYRGERMRAVKVAGRCIWSARIWPWSNTWPRIWCENPKGKHSLKVRRKLANLNADYLETLIRQTTP